MKVIILARVSDPKQDSNNAQLTRIQEQPVKLGIPVWKVYELEESSTKGNRKKFQQIIDDIKNSKEPIALFVDTIDRLQRSFKESVLFDELRKEGKVQIHFFREGLVINKDSGNADLLRWDMGVMFARSYVLQLSDNVKRKFEQMRRNGEWTGRVRTGYERVTDIDGKKNIVPHSTMGHLIKPLFEAYSTGNHSYQTIADHAYKIGLRSCTNKRLTKSNIECILSDTFYYGIAKPEKYPAYPHIYEQLISQELYDRCKAVREGRSRSKTKLASADYIFKGLLRCQNCGCMLSPEIKKGRFIYYSCTNSKRICKRIYVPEKELLKPINETFEKFSNIPDKVIERLVTELRKINENAVEYHHAQVTRVQSEYNALQTRIDRLMDLLIDQSITRVEYDKKLQEMKDKQYRLGLELDEHTKADHEYHIHVATVLHLAQKTKEIFKSSEVHEKRAILNFLLQNPKVEGKKLNYSLKIPFNSILELAENPTCTNGLRGLDDVRTSLMSITDLNLFAIVRTW